jgi:hypothetical protein
MSSGQRGSGTSRKYAWLQLAKMFRPALGSPAGFKDGKEFFVDASATDASSTGDGSPEFPLSTINAAYDKCVTGRGDVIYVAPRHAENIAAATSLVMDLADVSIIGLGTGDNRPTLTYTAADGNIPISGIGSRFENFILTVTTALDIAAGITISAAGVTVKDVEVRATGATMEFVVGILTTAAADRLHVDGLKYTMFDGGASTHGIHLIGVTDALIENSRFYGTISTGCVVMATTLSTNVRVKKCSFHNKSAALAKDVVATVTGCTYSIEDCIDTLANVTSDPEPAKGAGAVFHVDDGGNAFNNGCCWLSPANSIDDGNNLCTTARGDTVYVSSSYAETIANNTSIVLDLADVTIVGKGEGDDRPTITFGTAITANIPISGAGVTFENFIITTAGTFDITAGITVSAAGVKLRDIEFRGVDADTDFSTCVLTTNAAERLTVEGCIFRSAGTLPAAGVGAVGAIDGLVVKGCKFFGAFTTACVDFVTGGSALTNAIIEDCVFSNTGNALLVKNVVDTVTGSTWMLRNCYDMLVGAPIEGGHITPIRPSQGSLGIKVSKTTADVLTGAAAGIFTVATGRVLVTGIVGEVTTNIQAQATTFKYNVVPTAGAAHDLCATLDITGSAAGTILGFNPTDSTAACLPHAFISSGVGVVVEAGAIQVTTGADSTGSIKFDLWYIPLEAGATVASA